jgi:uncharacterized repeat protein (TIGR03943 family)
MNEDLMHSQSDGDHEHGPHPAQNHDHHHHDHDHDHDARRLRWNPIRLLRGLALGAWGAFFVWLMTSGSAAVYVAPRTDWVVAIGAVTLPLIALAYLIGVRRPGRAPSRREIGTNGLLVAPILFALMVPAQSLGSQAVKNKVVANAPAPADAPTDGQVRLFEIAFASSDAEFASAAGLAAGTEVDFVGFVSAEAGEAGLLDVSRFKLTHCAADATAYTVQVKLPGDANPSAYGLDSWVSVKGKLEGTPGAGLTVAATSLEEVSEPADAYGYW